jgi:hypothetical protein
MANRATNKGRGVNRSGRSANGDRFVKLDHWMLDSPAWLSLKAIDRDLLIWIQRRYNGQNNGQISMSQREAAELLHVKPETAAAAFHRLTERGFIRMARDSSFTMKARLARTWILTMFEYRGQLPTKEFMGWRPKPENQNTYPKRDTDCADRGYTSAA